MLTLSIHEINTKQKAYIFYIKKYWDFQKLITVSCFPSLFLFLLFVGCKKKDSPTSLSPPATISDSTFEITTVIETDINDCDIAYQITSPEGESFSNVKLHWSTNSDFSKGDSFLISNSVTGQIIQKYSLKRLKQSTNYFTRLSLTYKNKTFFSTAKEFKTDTLMLLDFPTSLSREVSSEIKSNFKEVSARNDSSTKIYLNDILCTIPFTNGEITQFIPPSTLVSKKYALKFQRNGISVQAPDSIELLKGKWTVITSPVFPLAPRFSENGIGFYGSCFSEEKGYIIPGNYFHQIPYGDANFGRPGHILEFDGTTNQWTNIPGDPMCFETPVCHYANNAIYVLNGWTATIYDGDYQKIKRVLKFDLNTLKWETLDSLPYSSIDNMVSFQYNNEFFIGMGADENNRSTYCGYPQQSKKFWKYSPTANSWIQLADFPGNHDFNQSYPTAFTIGSKAYVFYGAIPVGDQPLVTTNFREELWQYDMVNNIWTQLNLPATGGPPPGEKYQIFSYNGKAYFISAQKRDLFSYYYGYTLKTPCLEFDPSDGSFKKISTSNNLGIMKLIFRKGNQFFFQTDAFGYTENIPNKTLLLTLE